MMEPKMALAAETDLLMNLLTVEKVVEIMPTE